MENGHGKYRYDDGAVAEYDQIKAKAMDSLAGSDGFVIVCATWDNEGTEDEELNIVVSSGTTKMDPAVFMALSCAEVAKLTKTAVLQISGGEELEDTLDK